MTILEQMLIQYNKDLLLDKKSTIKEIVQEVILAGLSKTDFFKKAAFYGGTALRIYHGLDRFSEDLDFTLLKPDKEFNFDNYIPAINNIVESLGLSFEVKTKTKQLDSNIKSAFIKGNTKEHFLIFYPDSNQSDFIQSDELIKIKIEIDIEPPLHATTETKYRLLPYPYEVRLYDKPSLFAGKIHAVLARKWGQRVKGRDFYDYVYYLASNTKVNIKHLELRLKQTNTIDKDITLTKEYLIKLLNNRFCEIDYKQATTDVKPFIQNKERLDIWSKDFFISITENLEILN